MQRKNAYPTKTTLNLMIRERQGGDPRVLIPAALVGAILVALFCRYAVVGRLMQAYEAEQAAIQAEQALAAAQEELTVYDEVEAEYSRYFSDALFSDDIPQECMDVLGMMESKLMGKVSVTSYSFSGNTLVLQLKMSRLGVTSELIESLYHVPMVDYVSISTASDNLRKPITEEAPEGAAEAEEAAAPAETAQTVQTEDSGESIVIMTITLREVEEE